MNRTALCFSPDMLRHLLYCAFGAFGAFAALPHVAAANGVEWPSRPIRLIVPGGVGGVTDIRARWLADHLATRLGQPIIVENKPGAGGNIGTAQAAHSVPDGYTLVIIHQGTMTINPHLYARPGYDPLTDLIPIAQIGTGPLLLVVNANVPVTNVRELIQLAKAKPGQLSFGSPGIGTPPHVAGELFRKMAGIDTVHVPYQGGGKEIADLIAGHISYSIEGINLLLPQVRSGRLRALAVTGSRRFASLPDVPTINEAGVPGFDFIGWVGIAAPSGTPKAIVERIQQAIAALYATPEAGQWFAEMDATPGELSSAAFAAALRAEYVRWGSVMPALGIRVE